MRRVPARIRGEGPPRAAQPARHRVADRHLRGSRAGGRRRPARRRLPRLRPRGEARAHGADAGHGARPAGEPLRRRLHARPLRPRGEPRRGARRRPRRGGGEAQRPAHGGARGRWDDRADGALALARGLRGRRPPREGPHPRRRRVPDRPLAAGGAPDRRHAARRLPLVTAHQPLAVPLPPGARWDLARRLLTRDAREARGLACLPQPDRWHDDAGRG
jgi:hypothetical protein